MAHRGCKKTPRKNTHGAGIFYSRQSKLNFRLRDRETDRVDIRPKNEKISQIAYLPHIKGAFRIIFRAPIWPSWYTLDSKFPPKGASKRGGILSWTSAKNIPRIKRNSEIFFFIDKGFSFMGRKDFWMDLFREIRQVIATKEALFMLPWSNFEVEKSISRPCSEFCSGTLNSNLEGKRIQQGVKKNLQPWTIQNPCFDFSDKVKRGSLQMLGKHKKSRLSKHNKLKLLNLLHLRRKIASVNGSTFPTFEYA